MTWNYIKAMDKKLISYVGFTVGIVLIFLGGGLLYLRGKSVKKVEIVISTPTVKSWSLVPIVSKTSVSAEKLQSSQKRKISFKYRSSKPKSVFLVGDFNKWNRKANPMKRG